MLSFFVINDRSALIVAAFRAHRVGRNGAAALRAIGDLTSLDAIVAASFSGPTIGVFTFWDCHRRGSKWLVGEMDR